MSSSTSSTEGGGWTRAGRVGRPHGLDGSFHVTGARAELLAVGTAVRVADTTPEVARRAGTAARPIVRLSGCEDRDAAAALRGEELRVAPPPAPELEEGEFRAEQLEGCRVHDGDIAVGFVRRLIALPSCEVLEVARDGRGDLLVPMVRDAVRTIDPGARRIEVDLRFLGVE